MTTREHGYVPTHSRVLSKSGHYQVPVRVPELMKPTYVDYPQGRNGRGAGQLDRFGLDPRHTVLDGCLRLLQASALADCPHPRPALCPHPIRPPCQMPGHDKSIHRPYGLDPLTISLGDTVSFEYSTNHDVWNLKSLEALEACDFSRAELVAGREAGGECANDRCMPQVAYEDRFELTPEQPGVLYLSSSVADQCANGLRLTVTVEDPSSVAWRGGIENAFHHVVPFWTDNYGYCEPIPGLPEGVHRPRGLHPLIVRVGQPVLFTFSTEHDVWQHPSRESWEACDHTGATMLADRYEGGGCAHETDAACMAIAKPFVLTPTRPEDLYLSCSIGDHCRNGQRTEPGCKRLARVVLRLTGPCVWLPVTAHLLHSQVLRSS